MKKRMRYRTMPPGVFLELLGTDAYRWADAFMEVTEDKSIDQELMIGWFANAIMAAYDHGRREASAESRRKSLTAARKLPDV